MNGFARMVLVGLMLALVLGAGGCVVFAIMQFGERSPDVAPLTYLVYALIMIGGIAGCAVASAVLDMQDDVEALRLLAEAERHANENERSARAKALKAAS